MCPRACPGVARAKASDARDLYWSLRDLEKKRAWEALDRDGKLAQLHELSTRLERTKALILEWHAKVPAWDRKLAEREPAQTPEAQIQVWMDHFSNPYPMIETLEEARQEMESERDWLLARL
jgi:hypothetical protein